MQKFFIEENQIQNDLVSIMGEDVKHISNVLRMKKGEIIEIGNKQKLESYKAKILTIEKEKVIAKILEKNSTNNEPNIKVDLYQGLPKADKMEWVIQKTTEIGIDKIIPVDMSRCIVKLNEKESKKKIERWQKIAEGAAKQSKRDKIPIIENKVNILCLEDKIKQYDLFLIAYEEEKNNTCKKELQNLLKKSKYKIAILVGPEGGLEEKEIKKLIEKGAKVITLGKRILRTETAPIVLLSNIMYELEE